MGSGENLATMKVEGGKYKDGHHSPPRVSTSFAFFCSF